MRESARRHDDKAHPERLEGLCPQKHHALVLQQHQRGRYLQVLCCVEQGVCGCGRQAHALLPVLSVVPGISEHHVARGRLRDVR